MRLRRSDPSSAGIRRIRRGRGFGYERDGRPVRDRATLGRIRALVLPPAWQDVWICPDANGHIQATGTDAAGRRQYRYHDSWRVQRDAAKFVHAQVFARALRRLRRQVRVDLAGRGLTQPRVLAVGARLLDRVALRIGGEAYAQGEDATFGLATLRRDHVEVRGQRVRFCFPGKGALPVEREVDDAALATAVRALLARSDDHEELLGFWSGRQWRDIHSEDINTYLRAVSGVEMSAKDFRTWHATVAAALALAMAGPASTAAGYRRGDAADISLAGQHADSRAEVLCRHSGRRSVHRWRDHRATAGRAGCRVRVRRSRDLGAGGASGVTPAEVTQMGNDEAMGIVGKVAYKPVGMVAGIAAGLLAGAAFKQAWRGLSGESDAPHATDEQRGWGEILAAAALQGVIFAVVKAAVDRAGAVAVRRATGDWPS